MNHQSNSQKIQDWALPMLLDPAIPRGLFCVTMWYKCTEVEIIVALLISLSLFSNTADVLQHANVLQQQLSTQISFIGGSLYPLLFVSLNLEPINCEIIDFCKACESTK